MSNRVLTSASIAGSPGCARASPTATSRASSSTSDWASDHWMLSEFAVASWSIWRRASALTTQTTNPHTAIETVRTATATCSRVRMALMAPGRC